MKPITLDLTEREYQKLASRAARAELSLETYIVAAASDPFKYAWPEDAISTIAGLKN